jgi:exodeoxyribonuclease-3
LKIATWNVNSVRLRIGLLARWAEILKPDVICLQETKVTDELFPREACADMGYPHIAIHGQKSYNGVAILSRRPLENVRTPGWCGKVDCRHLIATIDGIDVHCVYIPAGGDIPDPDLNDKFAHKLQFVRELTAWMPDAIDPQRPAVLVGDLNIAPLETDVWSHKQLLKVVSHTPVETGLMAEMQKAGQWVDAVRTVIPPEEKLFTWWSYRSPDWTKNDRGRRLDHIWVTPALRPAISGAMVLREARAWDLASDHVPVQVDLTLG